MQNFNITPTSYFAAKSITFVHADASTDTGFTAPITWSIDQPNLATFENFSAPIRVNPTLPAAQNGGVVTMTGKFMNENGVQQSTSFTVTIVANPNPASGFTLA